MGVFLFKDSELDAAVNSVHIGVNFRNFLNALLVLFRCSTGEDWHKFM